MSRKTVKKQDVRKTPKEKRCTIDIDMIKKVSKIDKEPSDDVKNTIKRAREEGATTRTIPAIRKRI
ncbi:MAG: hypothetical protein SVV03_04055 [Candidatus Nanohaloarchaea archaeon]|nr:hypothetical protein [Candidatus Nanohaloarchaea archaeon]